ncbi:hypothetical protein F5141DRAFT_1061636 [Pisolithus sp. B1]|nr:hypothetical protein F5141DRAFT_1061636 [Pisolithus sp. B1]
MLHLVVKIAKFTTLLGNQIWKVTVALWSCATVPLWATCAVTTVPKELRENPQMQKLLGNPSQDFMEEAQRYFSGGKETLTMESLPFMGDGWAGNPSSFNEGPGAEGGEKDTSKEEDIPEDSTEVFLIPDISSNSVMNDDDNIGPEL